MTHISGFERSQLLLLPEAIDDYVAVDKLRAEFSLTALVYNLRRALNILGVEEMMAAVRA